MSGATCSEARCSKAVLAKGKCQTHYERDRDRHRHRGYGSERAIRTRARNRATAELVFMHKDEFDRLVEAHARVARTEVAEVEQRAQSRDVAPVNGVHRLMPGPRPTDQAVADRLREDVGRCPSCHTLHDSGHACPECGAKLAAVPVEVAS